MITIVGLGREKGDITKNGIKAIKSADKLFVRTLLSNAGKQVKKYNPISMDDLYESSQDFDELNSAITQRIFSCKDTENVVYCVDGDGISDSSVECIYALESQIRFVTGVSMASANIPTCNMLSLSAHDVVKIDTIFDTSIAVLVHSVSDMFVAGDVKLSLLNYFGLDDTAYITTGCKVEKITVADIDRAKKYKYDTAVFIPATVDFKKERYSYHDLERILKRLTASDGCEWDKVQTHQSIAINAIEESYELCEAIANDDIDNMCEEAGDVILQGVFHGNIAERYGEFTTADCIDMLCKKLVYRHTHIFGKDRASNPEEALVFWEKAKEQEKNVFSISEKLDKIPVTYPSMLKLEKAIKKIVKAGFVLDEKMIQSLLLQYSEKNDAIGIMVCAVMLSVSGGISCESELIRVTNKIIDNAKNADEIKNLKVEELISGK